MKELSDLAKDLYSTMAQVCFHLVERATEDQVLDFDFGNALTTYYHTTMGEEHSLDSI